MVRNHSSCAPQASTWLGATARRYSSLRIRKCKTHGVFNALRGHQMHEEPGARAAPDVEHSRRAGAARLLGVVVEFAPLRGFEVVVGSFHIAHE